MGLDSLLAKLSGQIVTHVTPPGNQTLHLKTPLPLSVTLVTPVTPENIKADGKTDLPGQSPEPEATTKPKKQQVSCRAFKVTRIHAVTKAKHCLDRQGPHCGDCELRENGNYQTLLKVQ